MYKCQRLSVKITYKTFTVNLGHITWDIHCIVNWEKVHRLGNGIIATRSGRMIAVLFVHWF